MRYFVKPVFDPEANVWFAETNVPGLVIEAKTLAEFEELARSLGPDLLAENRVAVGVRIPNGLPERTSIKWLEISYRTSRILERAGAKDMRDLLTLIVEGRLRRISGVGPKAEREVREAMATAMRNL